MKIIILILLILLGFAYPLKSDTLYLNNGDRINGQLLKITSAGLIFEVRSGLFITGYKTLPTGDVLKVIDDFGKVLFADNLLKVDYLADYYNNPQPQLTYLQRLDTLYLSDNSRQIVYITHVSDKFLYYQQSPAPPEETQQYPIQQIIGINGGSVKKYLQSNRDYPKERIMTYPTWGIEINYGSIMTQLGSLSNLKIDSTIAGAGVLETHQFRTVNNNYSSFQLGIFLQINPYLSIHALGYYTLGFNKSTGENNEPQKEESSYLAASEIHLTYPEYFIKPWVGLGYAHQSYTIISNFGDFDAIWNSQSNSVEYSAGLDIKSTSTSMLSLSWRLMTFPKKPVSKGYSGNSIDLAKQVFSIGLKFLL
jgi:opacity protein-like surface antigen